MYEVLQADGEKSNGEGRGGNRENLTTISSLTNSDVLVPGDFCYRVVFEVNFGDLSCVCAWRRD